MPNRIIKESICYSEDINNLTPEEEVFFYRLMVNCDDHGRCDARLPILKAKLYPLREDMKSDNILGYLLRLEQNRMIVLYENNGIRYLELSNWSKHQQIRAKWSKHPAPNDDGSHLISLDINCNQMISFAPENPNPNPNPNLNRLSNDNLVVGTTTVSEPTDVLADETNQPAPDNAVPSTIGIEIINTPLEEIDQVDLDAISQNPNNDNCPYDAIKDAFLNICTTLPRIKDIRDTRRKKILKLWKQKKSLEYFKDLFERTARSDFLSGRDGKWPNCSFDWIIEPTNMTKIFEGNYDNKGSPGNLKVIQCNNFAQRDYALEDINRYYANVK